MQIAFIIYRVGWLRNACVQVSTESSAQNYGVRSNTSARKPKRKAYVGKRGLFLITSSLSCSRHPSQGVQSALGASRSHSHVPLSHLTCREQRFLVQDQIRLIKGGGVYLKCPPYPFLPADSNTCDISPPWDPVSIYLCSAAYEDSASFRVTRWRRRGRRGQGKMERLLGIESR